MSLYGDLPPPTKSDAADSEVVKIAPAWSNIPIQPAVTPAKKKERTQNATSSSSLITPIFMPKTIASTTKQTMEKASALPLESPSGITDSSLMADALIQLEDEYQPWEPNDYVEYVRLKEEQENQKRDMEARQLSLSSSFSATNTEKNSEQKLSGEAFARKFMEKLGWREGEGLGKERQGMNVALSVKKTSTHGGIIVDKSTKRPRISFQKAFSPHEDAFANYQTESRVIMLTNMVGRGEVDDALQDETASECAKYGVVDSCFVYELGDDVPDEESVRIFVQFSTFEAASRALADLEGRFFGGKQIRAVLYSENLYINKEFTASTK